MASARKIVLPLSQLSINEDPPDEYILSRTRQGTLQSENCGEVEEVNMVDESRTATPALGKASGFGHEGKITLHECENEFCTGNCAESGETLAPRTSDININDNYGTVNVIVPNANEPTTERRIKRKTFGLPYGSPARKFAHFPTKSSQNTPGVWPSRNISGNQLECGRIKRLPRQSKINFRQRKKRGNVKFVSGQISNMKENNEAVSQTVNIYVNNNKGVIMVGDENTCYHGPPGWNGRQQSDESDKSMLTDGPVIVSPQRALGVCTDRTTKVWLNKVYRVTNEIYPLRDNGRWEDFYNKLNRGLKLAKEKGLQEEEILLTIEKSTGLSYQGKNNESKKIVKEAETMILCGSGLNMREYLVVLLECTLAAHYRRDKKLSKAHSSIHLAEQMAESVPSTLLQSYITYEKARLASDKFVKFSYFPALDEEDGQSCEEEAKKCFENCISMCELTLSNNKTIYLRRHHFSLVMLALVNLKSGTTASRSQPVGKDNISEAEDCIKKMEQYSEQMSECTKMLLLNAKTGLFHRRGDYANAEMFASQALSKAQSLGYEIEMKRLEEHLKELSLLKQPQQQALGSSFPTADMEL